ncbi:MAG: lysylphosphatidylglycerol synthase transmembrane domain-containing protein [Vicinamibacterales bacterium]
MSSARSSTRRSLLIVIKIGVSAGLLALVLRGTDLSRLWERLRDMHAGWLLLALSAYVGMMAVGVWRWHGLLRAQHVEVPRRRLAESMWVSQFFNNFLPSNIGGDVIRIADTARAAGSKTLATTVVLVDRGLGLLALLLVAALGSLAAKTFGVPVPGSEWLWMVTGAGVVVAAPVLGAPQMMSTLLKPVRALGRPWLTERAVRIEDAFSRFRQRPSALLSAFCGAVVVHGGIIAFYALTARGLAIPLPVLLAAVVVPVSLVVQMAPVSINGFGVREAVFTYFFTRFGLSAEAAVALSLVGTGLIMLQSLAGGVMFFARARRA